MDVEMANPAIRQRRSSTSTATSTPRSSGGADAFALPPSANLDRAKAVTESFAAMENRLYLLNMPEAFHKKDLSKLGDGPLNRDPAAVKAEAAAQIAYLRKLKFQYIEQQAKDKYVKTITDDDPQLISPDDNFAQQALNEQKKAALKEAKRQLEERVNAVKELAPMVEADYRKAKALNDTVVDYTNKILDARLALTRLRASRGPPVDSAPGTLNMSRLTITTATALCDAQVAEMQTLESEHSDVQDTLASIKQRVKKDAKEVEGLRAERAVLEREVKSKLGEDGEGADQKGGEEGRRKREEERVVGGLYDWFTSALDLHRALFDLRSLEMPTENSIHLIYGIDPSAPTPLTLLSNSNPPVKPRSPPSATREIGITLLFLPNTRRLAEAKIVERIPVSPRSRTGNGKDGEAEADAEEKPLTLGDVVDAHIQANDVPGLVGAVLARIRRGGA